MLGDVDEPTLPFGLSDVQGEGRGIEEARLALDAELSQRLRAQARALGVSAASLFHLAWAAVLARTSGREDVVSGTVLFGRMQGGEGADRALGMFINTLPVRLSVGDEGVAASVRRTHALLAALLRHEHAPLALAQRCSGVPAPSPLFSALLNYRYGSQEDAAGVQPAWEGIELLGGEERTNYPLTLSVDDLGEGFDLVAQVRPEIGAERICGFMETALTHLAGSLERAPEMPVRRLEVLPEAERHRVNTLPRIMPISNEKERFDLSYHQERLWFIDRFEVGTLYEGSPTYHNIPLIIDFCGNVDINIISEALDTVVSRHQVFRTRIQAEDGRGWQRLDQNSPVILKIGDFDGKDVIGQVIADTLMPFAVDNGELLRASLIRLSERRVVLSLTVHHIITDRTSMRLIAKELMEIVAARLEERPPKLPKLSIQYLDYACWQRALSQTAIRPLFTYWKRQLRGRLKAVELPFRQARPAIHVYSVARHEASLDEALARRLKTLNASEGVSTADIALAAFIATIRRYADDNEVVVGTSTSCRDDFAIKNIVGPIANLLVLRNYCDPEAEFRHFLQNVRRTRLDALKHKEMQFDKLASLLKLDIDMSRTVLFDILFEYDEAEQEKLLCHDLTARVIETNIGYGKYDLHLYMNEDGEGIDIKLTYNKELFDAELIQQLMSHYLIFLEAISADPSQVISCVNLLTEKEISQQLIGWNHTAADFPQDKTVHELFEAQAARTPDAVAVAHQDRALTYVELNARANRLAHYLRKLGVGPDVPVAIQLEGSLDMIVALLGVLKAGGAYVPIDPKYPLERKRFILNDCGSRHAVTVQEFAGLFSELIPEIVLMDGDGEKISAESSVNPTNIAKPNNLVYIIYTSGSTGIPKGVLIEHKNVVRLMANDQFPFNLSDKDVWSMFHSYTFDFSVWEMYGALLYGGKLVMIPDSARKEPLLFLEIIRREQITMLSHTPSYFYNLVNEVLSCPGALFPSVRYVVLGGEPLNPAKLREFHDRYPSVELINMYGITETCVHVTFKKIGEREIKSGHSNIGAPIPTTTVYIMDSEQRLVPVGVAGEICVGGLGVGRGYLNRDALTRERFVTNPYKSDERLYRSGDLGRYLRNGEIVYHGRNDHQVKIRGFRIELGEIEARLEEYPGVRQAVVLAREDSPGGKRLVAYYAGGEEIEAGALRAHLAAALPEYMVASAYVRLERLPLTANGKLDREALPAPEGDAYARGGYEAPLGETEELLAQILVGAARGRAHRPARQFLRAWRPFAARGDADGAAAAGLERGSGARRAVCETGAGGLRPCSRRLFGKHPACDCSCGAGRGASFVLCPAAAVVPGPVRGSERSLSHAGRHKADGSA